MTTHYQKIQALGNKMADNLTTMGISSSFGEGGLTLADKILQIQHFTDGILLCADKAIAQSGDTVKFTVLYLENGESVSGKEVFFDGAYSSGVSRSIPSSVDTPVGKKYAITSLPDVNTYLDKDHSLLIFKNGFPKCMLVANNVQYSGTNFIMDNGVIKYTDLNNVQQTVDVSNYDTSVVYPLGSGLVLTDYGVIVTDNYGVATASYDCTGAGKKIFTAKCGILQVPYSIYDTLWYDKALDGSGNHNDNYNSITNLSRASDGTTYSMPSAWTQLMPKINNSTQLPIGEGLCIEFDILTLDANGGQIRLTIYDGSNRNTVISATGHYKVTITDKIRVYKDESTTPFNEVDYDTTKTSVQSIFTNSVAGASLKFKDYKIYPI